MVTVTSGKQHVGFVYCSTKCHPSCKVKELSIGHSSVMSVGNFMFNLSTINSINMYSPLLQQENYKLQYIHIIQYIEYNIHTYCIHKTSFTTNICIWWILYNNTRFTVYKQILHFNVHIQTWSPLNKKSNAKSHDIRNNLSKKFTLLKSVNGWQFV